MKENIEAMPLGDVWEYYDSDKDGNTVDAIEISIPGVAFADGINRCVNAILDVKDDPDFFDKLMPKAIHALEAFGSAIVCPIHLECDHGYLVPTEEQMYSEVFYPHDGAANLFPDFPEDVWVTLYPKDKKEDKQ